jgi:hypothetical protein
MCFSMFMFVARIDNNFIRRLGHEGVCDTIAPHKYSPWISVLWCICFQFYGAIKCLIQAILWITYLSYKTVTLQRATYERKETRNNDIVFNKLLYVLHSFFNVASYALLILLIKKYCQCIKEENSTLFSCCFAFCVLLYDCCIFCNRFNINRTFHYECAYAIKISWLSYAKMANMAWSR